ncbi:hypothetical protein GCM10027599_23920 [Yimella radicis]
MESLPDAMAAYLSATRGPHCLSGGSPELTILYDGLYERLGKIVGELFGVQITPPILATIYSRVAHAETVSLGGRAYIVYDQYLGQVFNKLNRLFFEDSSPAEVHEYLHKLYAARGLACGRPQLAASHAVAHASLFEYLNSQARQADVNPEAKGELFRIRSFYTASQEAFVMAHELAHYIFRTHVHEAEVFEQYCVELSSLANMPRGADSTESKLLDLEKQRRADLASGPGLGQRHARDGLPKLPGSSMSSMAVLEMFGIDRFDAETNAAVLEECICDSAALFAACLVFGLDNVGDAVAASFMGLHHLRLMRMADQELLNPYVGDNNIPMLKDVGITQYRFAFFRNMERAFRSFVWPGLPDASLQARAEPFAGENLGLSLIELNDLYDIKIGINVGEVQKVGRSEEMKRAAEQFRSRSNVADGHDVVGLLCDLPA